MSEAGTGSPTGPEPRGAVRLIFQYEGDEVRLVSSRHIDKVVPPDDEAETDEERQGFYAEVRGADDRVLRRRLLHAPVRRDAEVFTDEGDRALSRIPVERPSGVFSLVVPDLEEADYVALVERREPDRPGFAALPSELIRVPLRGTDPGDGS
ncbi:MAG TPA: hypothetical protein VNK73_17300 [Actinomycetota bacterium]|nr:hypothetical protein [Actinomycetota bacterium]